MSTTQCLFGLWCLVFGLWSLAFGLRFFLLPNRTAHCLLLFGALLRRQPGTNFLKRMVAVLHYSANKIIPIDRNRRQQNCRYFLKAIVDRVGCLHILTAGQFYRRVYRPISQ